MMLTTDLELLPGILLAFLSIEQCFTAVSSINYMYPPPVLYINLIE